MIENYGILGWIVIGLLAGGVAKLASQFDRRAAVPRFGRHVVEHLHDRVRQDQRRRRTSR